MAQWGKKTELTGKTLRWVVCVVLFDARRALTVAEIVTEVKTRGFAIAGTRAGKSVSDALRWEVARGRVELVRRGVYAPGWMQRSTEYSLRQRVRALEQPEEDAAAAGNWVDEIDLDALDTFDTSDAWSLSPAPAIAVDDL